MNLLPLPLVGEGWGEGAAERLPQASRCECTALTPALSRTREREAAVRLAERCYLPCHGLGPLGEAPKALRGVHFIARTASTSRSGTRAASAMPRRDHSACASSPSWPASSSSLRR